MKVPSKRGGGKLNKAWLHDHLNDPWVRLANKEGFRARAAYKLKEIDEAYGLVKPGARVVDLGSSPGAWSQYLRQCLGSTGTVVALDLLPMEPVAGVHFIQGDFRDDAVLAELETAVAGEALDLVVSDMAPNLSGIASADAARVEHLVELAVEFALAHLKPGGALVAKVFHGASYDPLVALMRGRFREVRPFKPKSSRDRSAETFLVARGPKRADTP